MNTTKEELVPENVKGKATDIAHSVTFDNPGEARVTFNRAYMRMLNVNIWHKLSGFGSAGFVLRNEQGYETNRLVQKGDYFQIDIPGPGPSAGDGYDWVQVEEIIDKSNPGANEELFGMRVRSCKNPNRLSGDTAHFFTSDATSTFIITRKDQTVYSSYSGRNEVPNIHTEKLLDNIRNTLIGVTALAGISELQWSRLIKSFLEKEI